MFFTTTCTPQGCVYIDINGYHISHIRHIVMLVTKRTKINYSEKFKELDDIRSVVRSNYQASTPCASWTLNSIMFKISQRLRISSLWLLAITVFRLSNSGCLAP